MTLNVCILEASVLTFFSSMLRPMIGAEQELMDQETVLPKAGVFIINPSINPQKAKKGQQS